MKTPKKRKRVYRVEFELWEDVEALKSAGLYPSLVSQIKKSISIDFPTSYEEIKNLKIRRVKA